MNEFKMNSFLEMTFILNDGASATCVLSLHRKKCDVSNTVKSEDVEV